MSDRLEELNQICMKCQMARLPQPVSPTACNRCGIGREIHNLEVKQQSKWTQVDWNSAKFKDYYHG